jgi:anti-sigma regulatory factor (Ser/Thr protein kinase)
VVSTERFTPATTDRPNATQLVAIGVAARILGLSTQRVRDLVQEGKLEAKLTSGGHRRFDPVDLYRFRGSAPTPSGRGLFLQEYGLLGADEHEIWIDLQSELSISGAATMIARYAVTEMVNNAIDHSGGAGVVVSARADTQGRVVITISDDGEGLFQHLANGLGLEKSLDALSELSKGRRTTDPARHTGEGIFFTSKAVDEFSVDANGYRLAFDNIRHDFAYGTSETRAGTIVTIVLEPRTEADLAELFQRFTEDYEFSKTRPLIKLYEIGVSFVSRSEAKRLANGLEKFQEVELDFAKVDSIGQGFADELFRVWAKAHPGTALIAVGMNEPVAFMINRVAPPPAEAHESSESHQPEPG